MASVFELYFPRTEDRVKNATILNTIYWRTEQFVDIKGIYEPLLENFKAKENNSKKASSLDREE
jgi:hypothetical protein